MQRFKITAQFSDNHTYDFIYLGDLHGMKEKLKSLALTGMWATAPLSQVGDMFYPATSIVAFFVPAGLPVLEDV